MSRIGNKATALLAAGVFAGGMSGCTTGESMYVDHSPETEGELAEVLRPKLNKLGALALKLEQKYPENVYGYYDSDDKTYEVSSYYEDNNPDPILDMTSEEGSFRVVFSAIPGTEKPDPKKVLYADISTNDEYDSGEEMKSGFMIESPKSGFNDTTSYRAEYVQDVDTADEPEESTEGFVTFVTDIDTFYVNPGQGDATAVTTAKYVTKKESMDVFMNDMRRVAKQPEVAEPTPPPITEAPPVETNPI